MNIDEVARRAGVSRATVSRYFNNGYISDEKRRAIARVVSQTGFRPSPQAKNLRTGRTMLVEFVTTHLDDPSVAHTVGGLTSRLRSRGYRLLLETAHNINEELERLETCTDPRFVDGLIFTGSSIDGQLADRLDALSVPVVVIGQSGTGHASVTHDDHGAVHELTRGVLRDSAHPAFLGLSENVYCTADERRHGFLDACAEAGVTVPHDAVLRVDPAAATAAACRIMDAHPETDAFVCSSDTLAGGAIRAAYHTGRSVPEDIQVTGIGNDVVSRNGSLALTTADMYGEKTGEAAADLMCDIIAGRRDKLEQVRLGYGARWRATTL